MPTIRNKTDVAIILPTGHEIPPNATKVVSVDVATSVDNGPYLRLKMKTGALSFVAEPALTMDPLEGWIGGAGIGDLQSVLTAHGESIPNDEAASAVRRLAEAAAPKPAADGDDNGAR